MTDSDKPTPQQATFRLDLTQLREVSYKGIRRAAGFLGVGLNSLPSAPTSAALDQDSMWRFLPDPLPEQVASQLVGEFRIWLIANAFREIDLHFGLFIDDVWRFGQWARLHNSRVSWDHSVSDISQETNAASKYAKTLSSLEVADQDVSLLWSLSNTRNCLTHNAGVVRERDAKVDGQIAVKWLGLETRLQQGDDYIVFGPGRYGVQAPDPSKEAEVVTVVVERDKRFSIGQRIELSAAELHEICFYYMRLTDQLVQNLVEYCDRLGIPRSD